MYAHEAGSAPRSRDQYKVDANAQYTELYFSYASNLSPQAMKGRHPTSLFCGLAKLQNWRWNVNSTGYANVVPSPEGDAVYGALYFISAHDEAALDDMEGAPVNYQKQSLGVTRLSSDGSVTEQKVNALVYIDTIRQDEGEITPEYVVWIRKAIRDAKPFGLPDEYVQKYIRPFLPLSENEDVENDLQPVRMMFSQDAFK